MGRPGVLGRMVLLDVVSRLVAGRGLLGQEKEALRGQVRLLGFRKTARGHILRSLGDGRQPEGGLTVLAPAMDGLFTLAVDAADLVVGQEVLAAGAWEPHIAAFYARFLRPGMTVVDVGANIGFHSLHAACRVGPGGRVLAFEPDPRNAALIRTSLALREPRPPVDVFETALSDADGQLVLSDLGNPGNSGARFTHDSREHLATLVHGPRPRFTAVSARRFDDHFDLPRLDLIKIDVEGFEPRALAGMERSILRHRPVILTELAPSNLRDIGGADPEEFLGSLHRKGYSCSILEEPGGDLSPASPREAIGRVRGERHHVDLVLAPSGAASAL